jgi:malonyl CoA-acyl carrier protein transacylase
MTARSYTRVPRRRKGKVCEAVNFNAPGQIVIAGHREAVERAVPLAKLKVPSVA